MAALSEADHDRIFILSDRGQTCGQIARSLNKHPATVLWFMYSNGLAKPNLTYGRKDYVRNGRKTFRYSLQEDLLIVELRKKGVKVGEIASECNARFATDRNAHGISVRLVMLANCEEDLDAYASSLVAA